jgi:hypothetical protein
MNFPQRFEDVAKIQLAKFAEKVSASGGRAVIVVHPFWADDTIIGKPGEYEKENQQYSTYKKVLVGTIQRTPYPVIVLETPHKLQKTVDSLLIKHGVDKEKYLLLPTQVSSSVLATNQNTIESLTSHKALINLLHAAGAKKIMIAGTSTEYNFQEFSPKVFAHERKHTAKTLKVSKKWQITRGCVGSLYRALIESGLFERVALIPNACFDVRPILVRKRLQQTAKLAARRKTRILKR